MQQILTLWSTLDNWRRAIVIVAAVSVLVVVSGAFRMVTQPSLSLLYAGLDSNSAGEIMASLDAKGLIYDLRQGAIFVESRRRDATRMILAAEGLPTNVGKGYELLDTLSALRSVSQEFDSGYWRRVETELARTIMANPQVKSARVHISSLSGSGSLPDLAPSASVTVSTVAGGLSPPHATALKFLVASAVTGLTPQSVSVIDGRGGVVLAGEGTPAGRDIAQDRAANLRRNIQRILEARVGSGNAEVEVNVETETDRESLFERRFDPSSRIAISLETAESNTTDSGAPGRAESSELRQPEDIATGRQGNSTRESSERINYEVSETTREMLRTPGATKRISVAVLVDGLRDVDPETGEEIWQPRSAEELSDLQELVASVIGFNAGRGDSITLRTMEFQPRSTETDGSSNLFVKTISPDLIRLLQLLLLSLVALVLGVFVIRPVLLKTLQPVAALSPEAGMLPTSAPLPDLAASSQDDGSINGLRPPHEIAVVSPKEMLRANMLPFAESGGTDPVEQLRLLIETRKEETVEVLRSWMEDHEETT